MTTLPDDTRRAALNRATSPWSGGVFSSATFLASSGCDRQGRNEGPGRSADELLIVHLDAVIECHDA